MSFPHRSFLYGINYPDKQHLDQLPELKSYLSQVIRCPIGDVQLRSSAANDSKSQPSSPRLNIKTVFLSYGTPMLKIRRFHDRLIFNMEIHIMVRRHLYIETAPGPHFLQIEICEGPVYLFSMLQRQFS